ncbi:MAG: hypothetical protein UV57_C0023G0020 [Parcubacteria group bacterium GW2011_GWD2_43_10]|uniref:Uncharacterized protein n=5 Tax=Candidatus Vebleniibacteriota TaxID=1817921 RepID=A0A1G2Q618_9BACT|nr:MAG: hypothetical protein UV47_C0040G0003 [Parcubacteria group bacterium GW2011_GWA2_42_80]KKS79219.1 MAG: hypothetical protein UV52_C0014G0007 [Parcubacteria group bacterium GW2011_GWD1_42_9]KKS83154.1 MAG: hypothetical protein UV57_C0023G0020 [Parcubacteria group bacterium GW2011_GWD2_43_10]KKS94029.1 MAG: hypothetical protein UV69_C0002G0040 [Parcubacteria group bacterium GW2011_GWE2_43_12]KKT13880.1 MAG: hypothetical protein UV92_C0013G0003 [Parcubacteria group bacterium GW2011_GWA1_43_2
MEQVLDWLTKIGQVVIKYLPANYVNMLDRTLPVWAIGLGAAVIMAFMLKLITSMIFKIILWGALIIIFLIILQSFDVPIFDMITNIGK